MSHPRRNNKAFRHVETLFGQGNQVRTNQDKPLFVCLFVMFCLSLFKVCFDQYELDYLGRINFMHVEMPYGPLKHVCAHEHVGTEIVSTIT